VLSNEYKLRPSAHNGADGGETLVKIARPQLRRVPRIQLELSNGIGSQALHVWVGRWLRLTGSFARRSIRQHPDQSTTGSKAWPKTTGSTELNPEKRKNFQQLQSRRAER
jgi:hypothetical protein